MKRPFEYACRSLADVGQRHRVAGERDRDRRCRARAARCARAASTSGRNGSWLVSARERAVVAERPRASRACVADRVESAAEIRRRPSSSRSLRAGPDAATAVPGRDPRRCHTPAVPSDAWASRCRWSLSPSSSRRSRSARSRSGSPTSSGSPSRRRAVDHARARSCTGRSSCLLRPPADERTIDAALADLDARPRRARRPPRLRRARAHRRGVGAVPRRRRGARPAATSSSRTRRTVRPDRPGAEARGRARRTRAARHHRPARARRARRARRHRLQDRLGAVGVLRGQEPERRPHLRAPVRADARPAPGARAALLPLEARGDHRPPDRAVDPRASSARPARCGPRSPRACARDDFRPSPGRCATSARSSPTARRTAATPRTPPSSAARAP